MTVRCYILALKPQKTAKLCWFRQRRDRATLEKQSDRRTGRGEALECFVEHFFAATSPALLTSGLGAGGCLTAAGEASGLGWAHSAPWRRWRSHSTAGNPLAGDLWGDSRGLSGELLHKRDTWIYADQRFWQQGVLDQFTSLPFKPSTLKKEPPQSA